MPNGRPPPPALMTMRILWFALFMSTIAMFAILFFVHEVPSAPPPSSMVLGLGAAALGVAVVSFVLPARLYAQTVARARVDLMPGEGREAMQGSFLGGDSPGPRFAHQDTAMRSAFVAYQTPFILSLALSESVALFGFVLRMQGMAPTSVVPFFAVAWVLFLVRFPALARVLAPFERRFGAKFG